MNLQKQFAIFNRQYFGGKLPTYRIVRNDISGARCERKQRRIFMGTAAFAPPDIPGVLIHEMVHAATTDKHGVMFKRKLEELKKLGAPTLRSDFIEAQNLESRKALLGELLDGYWETANWSEQLRYRAFPIGIVNGHNKVTSRRWAPILRTAKKKYLTLKKQEQIYNRRRTQKFSGT